MLNRRKFISLISVLPFFGKSIAKSEDDIFEEYHKKPPLIGCRRTELVYDIKSEWIAKNRGEGITNIGCEFYIVEFVNRDGKEVYSGINLSKETKDRFSDSKYTKELFLQDEYSVGNAKFKKLNDNEWLMYAGDSFYEVVDRKDYYYKTEQRWDVLERDIQIHKYYTNKLVHLAFKGNRLT